MKTIESHELAAESLSMLTDAGPDGVLILADGKPVARLLPVAPTREKGSGHLIGALKGKVGIKGDVFTTG